MSIPSLIAVPLALILAGASTVSAAQDKSSAIIVSKPVSKPAKTTKSATPQQPVPVKASNSAPAKDATPATTQPLSERSYEGCHHGEGSDA